MKIQWLEVVTADPLWMSHGPLEIDFPLAGDASSIEGTKYGRGEWHPGTVVPSPTVVGLESWFH